jgi:hypothetical protein
MIGDAGEDVAEIGVGVEAVVTLGPSSDDPTVSLRAQTG